MIDDRFVRASTEVSLVMFRTLSGRSE